MKNFIFKTRAFTITPISWREALEDLRVMKSLLIKVILSLFDGLTKEHCIAAYLFLRSCQQIRRKSGSLFLALYLKQARVCLQKYVAKDSIPSQSVAVSVTRCGLPRIIPSFHRFKIKRQDHDIIQLYMSFFSVSKLIQLAPKISKNTFESISAAPESDEIFNVLSEVVPHVKDLLVRYVPSISTIPLNQGVVFKPTWKAVPTSAWYRRHLKNLYKELNIKTWFNPDKHIGFLHTFFYELTVFRRFQLTIFRKNELDTDSVKFCPPDSLWFKLVRYPFDNGVNDYLSTCYKDVSRDLVGNLPHIHDEEPPLPTGRLAAACSGEGKRRIFAIGNYVNQRLLEPFHKFLTDVLRRLKTDGTFDQTKPLWRLKGTTGTIYSVDLKAATDRWPIHMLMMVTQVLFGIQFAWTNVINTLQMNIFDIAFLKPVKADSRNGHKQAFRPQRITFNTGQPLGLLSSWPLFALSHHIIVWWAAEQVYPGRTFVKYAILGDDVVIADERVAKIYMSLIKRMGLTISVAKSLISPTGCCEFAKKFILNQMTVDVSPVSVKKILASISPVGWYNYISTLPKPLRWSTELRLAGVGFKAASRHPRSPNNKSYVRRLAVMKIHSQLASMSFELAISTALGFPIQPEVVGRVISNLLDHYVPKDIELPPDNSYEYQEAHEYNEYTILPEWVKMYLEYLRWNCLLRMRSDVTLECFKDVPIYINTLYRNDVGTEEFQTKFRFGITFKIYDMVLSLQGKNLPKLFPVIHPIDPNVIYLGPFSKG